MSLRVTIMMDATNDKKIRNRQAKTITQTGKSYSYSRCINDILREVKK
jgi:hypothetical protein